ncbi:ABC transporter ATP-binding protein [Polluticoccus soli]|uniref:ABC transporter ATP-binding protein n=1 Tax=Polluticoccus soli TaxID=3034150 RepID=UPI0023E32D58|nr:ABC transporter ATP-binding protein [Flavipsychrobacter sp. JY13-12]
MSNVVIKVEHLAKQYRLGAIGHGYLRDDVARYLAKLRGKEDPFSKIAEVNDRSTKGNSDYVWAIKDISFELRQGEVLGIVGKNGSGKSTLLKILSKVTKPTRGNIKMKGRVASLLEVGTGFNPDLTGRENIFLNGAILGMSTAEIKAKFDEIVDFSGVERYIDTPVKRYSSGMYVRLAFAVAAFLEPEILIIDEVLAVGDVEFQRKCLGKMKDVSNKEGRTVLFVSHNMGAIKGLCKSGLYLKNGMTERMGEINEVIDYFLQKDGGSFNDVGCPVREFDDNATIPIQLKKVWLTDMSGRTRSDFDVFDQVICNVEYKVREKVMGVTPIINVNRDGHELFRSFACDLDENILEGQEPDVYRYSVKLPLPLKKGFYQVSLGLGKLRVRDIDFADDALSFFVDELSFDPTNKSYTANRPGVVPALLKWEKV